MILLLRYGVRHSQEVLLSATQTERFLSVLQQTKGIAEFDSETYNIPAVLKTKNENFTEAYQPT